MDPHFLYFEAFESGTSSNWLYRLVVSLSNLQNLREKDKFWERLVNTNPVLGYPRSIDS